MITSQLKELFLHLVRLGIGTGVVNGSEFSDERSCKDERTVQGTVDWQALEALASAQGLSAIVVDGIGKLPETVRPPKEILLQWVGTTLQSESFQVRQQKTAEEMAKFFHENGIRTYVLKGAVIAECYPDSTHRLSADMDCYLMMDKESVGDSHYEAWMQGNNLIKTAGYQVDDGFYKNSGFYLAGLTVENHLFMTPFRGNKTLRKLEILLHGMMKDDKGECAFEGTFLCRPPVMVSSLFLIEHAYSHFLHEGMTWRMVLDWMMYSEKHRAEIDWNSLDAYLDEFGFRKFYDSYVRLGRYLMGEIDESELAYEDWLMHADVWAPLDLHESLHGLKAKFHLAGNTWRARWKYKHFAEISWIEALWIQVKGFLFLRNPQL